MSENFLEMEDEKAKPVYYPHTGQAKRETNGQDRGGEAWTANQRDIDCCSLAPTPISAIPPRKWAYGKFLLFGSAAAIGAVDGGGKGAHAVVVGLAMVTGLSTSRSGERDQSQSSRTRMTKPSGDVASPPHASITN
jgi:hypothetical protein